MEMKEILESKENLISFLKSQGFKEEPSYKDRKYKGVIFLKIGEKKLLAVCEAFSKEKIKEIKNHFLIDRGLTHVAIFFRDKILFYRNYGEGRYFIYSKRTAGNKSKISKLKKIKENFDIIFQKKDISGAFYEQFKLKRDLLVRAIKNDIEPVKKYLIAQKIFDRIFFIYFLCHKKIVRFDDGRELSGKVFFDILIENRDFIENLKKVFTLFNTAHKNNIFKIDNYKIRIPYLNGGLFREAEEEKDLKASLRNKDWQSIFEFLKNYHWIIESEIDDLKTIEEIEKDEIRKEAEILTPEILGHVYERSVVEWETKSFEKAVEEATKEVSERKKKGVYYTPEEITDYICKNTIYPYLLDHFGNKYKDINEFFEKASVSDIKKALKVLDEIKVLDPACGSGAFLLKAGEVLFYLKTALLNKLKEKGENIKIDYYKIKHSIITENLYGVDILEGAIEIAKLRLWLWLVSSYKEEKEIQALPNIEYNLIVGNSLIGWVNEKLTQISLTNPMTPEIKGIFKGLIANSIYEKKELQKAKELLEKTDLEGYIEAYHILYTIYKKAHGERAIHLKEILQTIRDAIYKSINPVFLSYINKNIKPNHGTKKPPIDIKDFEALNPLHWRVDFGHIIKNGGFNVVIGNPPYFSIDPKLKRIPSSEHIIFRKTYKVFHGQTDILVFFYERSINLLRNRGILGFISKNRWANSPSYQNFCRYLKDKNLKIIDFDDFFVFVDAGVTTNIIIIKKDRKPYLEYWLFDNSGFENIFKPSHYEIIKKELKTSENLDILSNEITGYIDKVGKYILEGGCGHKITPAKFFIIKKIGKNEFEPENKEIRTRVDNIKLSNKELKFVFRFTSSGSIFPYYIKDRRYIFYLRKSDLNQLPNIKFFFNKIKPKKGCDKWYEFHCGKGYRNIELIESNTKIIFPNRMYLNRKCSFYLDSNKLLIGMDCSAAKIKDPKANIKAVLVLLNSNLLWYYVRRKFKRYANRQTLSINKVPIKIPQNQQPFIHLADILLFLNQYHYDDFKSKNQENKELKEKISFFDELANCLVYELYLKEKLKMNLLKLIENKLKDVDYDNWIKLEFKDDLTPAEKKKKEEIEKKNLEIINKMFNELKDLKEIKNETKKIKNHEWVRIIEGEENE